MKRSILILVFSTALAAAVIAQTQVAPAPAQQDGTPSAQSTQQQAQQPSRTVVTTNLVIVPVTVKDSHGQLVADLTRDDFHVYEDNAERRIVSFSSDPVNISAVVLLDNDLSDKLKKQVQASLVAIAGAFGPHDEVALVTYDQFPTTVLDFSKDNDKLFTQLKRTELGSHSTFVYPDPATAGPINGAPQDPTSAVQVHGPPKYQAGDDLDDAVYTAGQMLKDRGRDRRKIIFLVSDGTNTHNNKHPFDQTAHSLLSADVSVYSISVTRSVPIGKSLIQRGVNSLENYAKITGGDMFYAAKEDDLDRMYTNVTEEARNEYTLTFQPNPSDKTKDFHSIVVTVDKPGLDVTSRDGYYLSSLIIGH